MVSLTIDICGGSKSGKSSLLKRFTQEAFDPNYHKTTGEHLGVKKIRVDDELVYMYLCDTYNNTTADKYDIDRLQGLDGIVFVHDCTNPNSLDTILDWQKKLEQEGRTHIPRMLLSNKTDLKNASDRRCQLVAKECGMIFFQVSAKSATQVEEAFVTLACAILKQKSEQANLNDIL